MEKTLSEVKNGQPARVDPVDADRAYSSWSSEPATTSGPGPSRGPTLREACTPKAGCVSDPGSVTALYHRVAPFGPTP